MQFMKELIREENIRMQIHNLGNLLWLWAPIKILYAKIVDVGQGRQHNIYVCSYSHRSYIVIDPSTCGACPPSLLAKNSTLSRDTTCASKTLSRNLVLRFHHTYLWIERVMPVMLRGFIPEDEWLVLAELSYFFHVLCAKELSLASQKNWNSWCWSWSTS